MPDTCVTQPMTIIYFTFVRNRCNHMWCYSADRRRTFRMFNIGIMRRAHFQKLRFLGNSFNNVGFVINDPPSV